MVKNSLVYAWFIQTYCSALRIYQPWYWALVCDGYFVPESGEGGVAE